MNKFNDNYDLLYPLCAISACCVNKSVATSLEIPISAIFHITLCRQDGLHILQLQVKLKPQNVNRNHTT